MDKGILPRIWNQLSKRRRIQLGLLLGLMLIASAAEIFSLGSIIPFLSALVAPEKIFEHPQAQWIIQQLRLTEPQDLILPLTVLFATAAVLAGGIRILLNYAQLQLAHTIGAEFGSKIFERTLQQPYLTHITRHSSEILSGVEKGSRIIQIALLPLLQTTSSIILVLAIVITLTIVQPAIALTSFGGFIIIYWSLYQLSRKNLQKNSQIIAHAANEYNKTIQEGLGGIRDVILDGTQKIFSNYFQKTYYDYQIKQASNQTLSLLPRFGVEALGMVLIALLTLWLSYTTEGILSAIPILGALTLGAQRMLPLVQLIYGSVVSLRGNIQSVKDALNLLEQPQPKVKLLPQLSFQKEIRLENVGFQYAADTPYVLENFSLTIPKGSRVGIKGTTGSGKSTLLDILMGLLEPQNGTINIDGIPLNSYESRKAWQKYIAHVPQHIFLSAATIAENIAFGIPKKEINLQRVKECASIAQIATTIEEMPKGYETQVGERGIRLSGGQRQRIGIARALYKNAEMLILDEATSALDQATEHEVMQFINALNPELTIIMVAHRLSTLENCVFILDLESVRNKNNLNHV